MALRWISVVVVVAGSMLVSCSSGTSGPTADEAAAGPWDDVPAPTRPAVALVVPQAGGQVIETVCVKLDGSGVEPPAIIPIDAIETQVAASFALLGADLVDQGCDATFSAALSANRISANYEMGAGVSLTCYPGWTFTGVSSMILDVTTVGTWQAEDTAEPPPAIVFDSSTSDADDCDDRDETLPPGTWETPLFAEPFGELFGDLGHFAWDFASVGTSQVSVSDELVDVLAYALTRSDDPTKSIMRLDSWTNDLAGRGDDASLNALVPLVPHLIGAWECAPALASGANKAIQCSPGNSRVPSTTGMLDDILTRITGEELYSQTQWWEWWEANAT